MYRKLLALGCGGMVAAALIGVLWPQDRAPRAAAADALPPSRARGAVSAPVAVPTPAPGPAPADAALPAAQAPDTDAPAAGGKEAEFRAEQQRLNVKYAQTALRLAEVNLQQATDINKRVANAYSDAEVSRLRRLVTFAKERLEWVQSSGRKQSDANIFFAQVALQSAESNYEKSQSASSRVPGAVSSLELERLRLTAELARQNVERARLAAESVSPVDDVQWELDQLRDDVMQLRSRVEAITARR